MTRSILLPLAILTLSFMTTSCDGRDALLSPDEDALAAKGGAPGKPTDGGGGGGDSPASSLVEYYVIPSADGAEANTLHVVVDGSAAHLGAVVVYDYFFNGIRDDDYSPHYEWFHTSLFHNEVVTALSNGHTHLDIEWHGEYQDNVYTCDENGENCTSETVIVRHPGHLATNVPTAEGHSADPYAFAPRVYDDSGTLIESWQPQGIIVDGTVVGPTARISDASPHHPGTEVTSYALHAGEKAPVRIGVQELSASGVSCETVTIREGKGKNRTETTVTELSATAGVRFGSSQASYSRFWAELHIRPVAGATLLPGGGSSINGTVSDTLEQASVSSRVEGELSGDVEVELVLDYLYHTAGDQPGTYDPGSNQVTTTAWPATAVGDQWPEATVNLGTVSCGG